MAVDGEYDVIHNSRIIQGVEGDLGLHPGEVAGDMLGDELLHDVAACSVVHDDFGHGFRMHPLR